MRIHCHVPITLRIVGVPTDDQLAAVGTALARAVAARLAEAQRLLAERHGGYGAGAVEIKEGYDAGREGVEGYAVPSYGHEGDPVAVPNRHPQQQGAPAPARPRPAARRDPTNPNNTLTADELYKIWQEYWVARHRKAGEREYALRTSLERLNPADYRQAKERFDLGLLDSFGSEYEAATAELDLCRTMTDLQPEVQEWLWAARQRGPVTFAEVNAAALDTARGRAWRAAYATPIAMGFLGLAGTPRQTVNRSDVGELPTAPEIAGGPATADAGSDPAGTSPPRSLGGDPLTRMIRNMTARAMIGLAEAESATRLPTGSPTVTERQLPTATAQASAPARPAATHEQPAATVPAPAPGEAGPAVADLSGATPSARAATPDSAGQPHQGLGRADDAALNREFDLAPSGATIAPGQGVVTVAPEVAAGVTPAQIQALRQVLGQSLRGAALSILAADWDAAARPGDAEILTAGNSRYLFGLHRNRFWRRVAANPAAVALLRDAGFTVDGGAPYLTLNGQRVTVTIDHITERQTAPNLTLTASNLRLSLSRENSVLLRLLHELDPFQ